MVWVNTLRYSNAIFIWFSCKIQNKICVFIHKKPTSWLYIDIISTTNWEREGERGNEFIIIPSKWAHFSIDFPFDVIATMHATHLPYCPVCHFQYNGNAIRTSKTKMSLCLLVRMFLLHFKWIPWDDLWSACYNCWRPDIFYSHCPQYIQSLWCFIF